MGREQLLLRRAEVHAPAGIDPQGPRAAHRTWLLQAAAQADRSVLRHELLDRGHRPAGAAAGWIAAQRGCGVMDMAREKALTRREALKGAAAISVSGLGHSSASAQPAPAVHAATK